MLIVLTSSDALVRNGKVDMSLVDVLKKAQADGNPTALISNHQKPAWFDGAFAGSQVKFIQEYGRQNGTVVSRNATHFKLNPFDVLVLASKGEDVQMGKNGGALLVAEDWSADPKVAALGVKMTSAADLSQIIELTAGWSGKWWFSVDAPRYSVRALSDLSTKKYGLTGTQQAFAYGLTTTVKKGGAKLNALLAVAARSMLMEGFGTKKDLVWGVYPSSDSANDDTEVLTDFTHRLRTTVSLARMAKKEEPLFIRHTHSSKRSAGGGGSRTDPTEQIQTIHLNPYYSKSGRLIGKNIVVVDDCTTYGVSFGVAAAFLRAAGATSVTGVALGKFGSQMLYYEIEIKSDPFKPVKTGGFVVSGTAPMPGTTNSTAQLSLQNLID